MIFRTLAMSVATLLLVAGAPAQAASIIKNYQFNSTYSNGATGSGTFSIEYLGGDTLTDPTLSAIDLVIGGFNWNLGNSQLIGSESVITLGGLVDNPNSIQASRIDFSLAFNSQSNATGFVNYSTGTALLFGNGQVTEIVSNAVPEPATWAMFLLGFGAVGYSMRRRKGTTASMSFA